MVKGTVEIVHLCSLVSLSCGHLNGWKWLEQLCQGHMSGALVLLHLTSVEVGLTQMTSLLISGSQAGMDGTAGLAGHCLMFLSLQSSLHDQLGLPYSLVISELSDSLYGSWQVPRYLGGSFKTYYDPFLFPNITSAAFYQLNKSLRPAQIQGEGIRLHLSMEGLANNIWPFLIDHTSHITQSPYLPRQFEAIYNLFPATSPIPSSINLPLVILLSVSQMYQLCSYLGPLRLLFPLPRVLTPR